MADIRTDGNGIKSIVGVRRLRWWEWRDCSYGGAVTATMNTMGVDVTYEDVMGMSGACYRVCLQENWDPSAGMPQCGFDVETPLYRALGFERYGIRDEQERRQKVVECVDRGMPVLCCGQRGAPEWGIITGYARGGEVFFGRTYFDYEGAGPDEVFTADGYHLADKFPGEYPEALMQFFDRRCAPVSPQAALRQSLEACIGTLNQGPGSYGYTRGYQAYDLWIRGLEDEGKFAVFPAGTNGYHLDQLRDARRCAHVYLARSVDLLRGDGRTHLERAAGLFMHIFDRLLAIAPYEGTESSFNGSAGDWTMGRRREFAALLRDVCALERQVEAELRTVLDGWDPQNP